MADPAPIHGRPALPHGLNKDPYSFRIASKSRRVDTTLAKRTADCCDQNGMSAQPRWHVRD